MLVHYTRSAGRCQNYAFPTSVPILLPFTQHEGAAKVQPCWAESRVPGYCPDRPGRHAQLGLIWTLRPKGNDSSIHVCRMIVVMEIESPGRSTSDTWVCADGGTRVPCPRIPGCPTIVEIAFKHCGKSAITDDRADQTSISIQDFYMIR